MDKRTGIMLILSLIGVISLLFLAQNLEPPKTTIASALSQNRSFFESNQEIKIIANLTSINQVKNSTTFLKLKDATGTISGVIFESSPPVLSLNKSKTYEIVGKISEYENQTEIIISKINPIISTNVKKK
jgi:exonuclease VII large subunit